MSELVQAWPVLPLDPDPSSMIRRAVARAEVCEPAVHALVESPDEERLFSTKPAPGPLHGVPVAVKDIFNVDGYPTRAGTSVPHELFAGEQSSCVTALLDAGALVLAKSETTEFAFFAPAPTRNPHDLSRTPGGSSSGSAAAVAAGYCPLAIGSQTAGSVIRPATFCGVVGFKATHGRIPLDGVVPLAPSLDTVGLFAADVAGIRLAASVVCPGWREPGDLSRPVLGVAEGPYLEQTELDALHEFERVVEQLRGAGFDVRRVAPFADFETITARHRTLMRGEMADVHRRWFAQYAQHYSDVLARAIAEGEALTAGEVADARAGRSDSANELEKRMDDAGVDVWISPAAAGPAPTPKTTGDPRMNSMWTYAGVPVVTLPAGRVDGLPVGLQCCGRAGRDEELLAASTAIEAALAINRT